MTHLDNVSPQRCASRSLRSGSAIKPELTFFGENGANGKSTPHRSTQITAEFNGQPLSASYAIEDGVVMVKTPHGEKVTQIDPLIPSG
jgi:hypothetical protein